MIMVGRDKLAGKYGRGKWTRRSEDEESRVGREQLDEWEEVERPGSTSGAGPEMRYARAI